MNFSRCIVSFSFSMLTILTTSKLEIPAKLQGWAGVITRLQPFLSKHAASAIIVNTKKTNWKDFSRFQSLSNSWSEVNHKQKKVKKVNLPKSYVTAASTHGEGSNPSTIAKETSKTSVAIETRGQKRKSNHNEVPAASDGKQYVLLPTLTVPVVCDGTYRVTLR